MDELASITCDYLIIGAGASGLAFADSLCQCGKDQGTKFKLVIVDERDQPGGHWNDTYKFARLHHPSQHYGVSSLPLEKPVPEGQELHRASPNEILAYYQEFMEKMVHEQGAVYFPMSTVRDGHKVVSLLDPKHEVQVKVKRKVVDTGFMRVQPPVARAPPFEIAMGAVVVPPNHLTSISIASPASKFVVIGAGRTGIDVVLWLLSRKVPPERLHWVMPRDHWLMCREAIVGDAWQVTNQLHMKSAVSSSSVQEMGANLDRHSLLCRVDRQQEPKTMHGACVSQAELAELRRVSNIVRLGRVRAVTATQLVLERGVHHVGEGALHVDCTSSWIQSAQEPVPLYTDDRIVVQPVSEVWVGPGEFNMPLSAAIVGFVEVVFGKKTALKNKLLTPCRWPDTISDWLQCHVTASRSAHLWSDRRISTWLCGDRLSTWSAMSMTAMRAVFSKEASEGTQKMSLSLEAMILADRIAAAKANAKPVGKAQTEAEATAKAEAEGKGSEEELQGSKPNTISGGTPPTPRSLPN